MNIFTYLLNKDLELNGKTVKCCAIYKCKSYFESRIEHILKYNEYLILFSNYIHSDITFLMVVIASYIVTFV